MRIAQVRSLFVVGILSIIAITTSWLAVANDSQTAAGREDCPPGAIPVDIELPEPEEVSVGVYNATNNTGLADTAAASLEEYGFEVVETGDSERDPEKLEDAVEIHYGPKAVAGAHLLQSYFGSVTPFFDIDNDSADVEIVLGPGFQQLNTESDARHALSTIGWPTAPEGTCAVE
ncbi:MAG: LytR C-terminal domain-containing protein [Stackebrandtia sp.]